MDRKIIGFMIELKSDYFDFDPIYIDLDLLEQRSFYVKHLKEDIKMSKEQYNEVSPHTKAAVSKNMSASEKNQVEKDLLLLYLEEIQEMSGPAWGHVQGIHDGKPFGVQMKFARRIKSDLTVLYKMLEQRREGF